MNSLSLALVIGFFLGVRHATDADHLVAVAAMLRRYGGLRGALFTGAAWGVGHSLTVLGVGTAMVVFGVVVPEGALPFMDLAVGLMLIGLGAGSHPDRTSRRAS